MTKEFGLPEDLADWLFCAGRALPELHQVVKLLLKDKYDFNL